MTDFLYRLAERALGQAVVAKPIVPTMFAPDGVGEAFDAGAETVSENTVTPNATPPASDQARRATLPAPVELPTADGLRAGTLRDGLEVGAPTSARFRPPKGNTPTGETVVPQEATSAPREQISPPARTSSRGAEPASLRADGADAQSEADAPAPKATSEIRTPTRTLAQPLAKTVTAGAIAEAADMTPAEGVPTPVRAARPPLIRVTIGRIEVRAILPAPAVARPVAKPAPAGALTLDEYLKQRSEGKR
jgi:hypothetical protein